MIAKGTTHNNGARLATYMVTAKPGEQAELWQLRGFASADIRDAFRSIHVINEPTHCEQPFFHVQVRNPENEHLNRVQWERVADRVESKLGLTDQPRAIAFHRDAATGHEHMHVAWSRIDEDSLTAKAMPFFKLRLKEVSRELETELGLTPVRNHRESPVMAPSRDEEEQAKRLNVEVRDVRQTIRAAWEHSDNGHSFRAALAEEGLTLAKGDKRDFVVIDHEGGINALGKRILGNTAAEIRARTADLDRDRLPTIEQAREQNARAKAELEATPPAKVIQQEPAPHSPVVDDIRSAYRQSSNVADFAATLERSGIRLAVVNAAEADRSRGAHREGDIVAVSQTGEVHQLNETTTGAARNKVDASLAALDCAELGSIEETQEQIHLEANRFVALSQVGIMPSPEMEIRPASPEVVDWERMLTDRTYRRQIEAREREQREAQRAQEQSQQRSRDPDRR